MGQQSLPWSTVDSKVLQVDISKDVEESAKEGISAEFTYSVQWHETDITFDKRMDKYRKYQFLPEHLDVCPWVPALRTQLLRFCPALHWTSISMAEPLVNSLSLGAAVLHTRACAPSFNDSRC